MHWLLVLTLFAVSPIFAPSVEAQSSEAPSVEAQSSEAASDIWSAAREGDRERVEALLESGVDVNAQTRYNATPLYFAAGYGHADVVDLLLKRGADPDLRDLFLLRSPLGRAVEGQHTAAAVRLIEHGVVDTMYTTLSDSVQRQLPEVVAALVRRGPVLDFEKQAALAAAREADSEELVKLIDGAKVSSELPVVELGAADLERLVGSYRDRAGEVVEVELAEGELRMKAGEAEPTQLVALNPYHFRSPQNHDRGAYFTGRLGIVEWMWVVDAADSKTYRRFEPEPDTAETTAEVTAAPGQRPADDALAPAPRKAAVSWPSFRGRHATGNGDGQGAPSTWDVETGRNVLWKMPIPGLAHSSPVVWGNRVFVTTAVSESGEPVAGERMGSFATHGGDDDAKHTWKTLALDAKTGKVVWQRDAASAVPLTGRHPTSSQANSTPATDGRHLVVVFPTAGMLCYDFEGNVVWRKDLGGLNAGNYVDASIHWGFAASPVIDDGKIILQADVHEGAFLAAYDVATGRELWKTPRDEVSGWATPLVFRDGDHVEIVTNAPTIRGYDFSTGRELWSLRPNSEQVVPAPIAAHGLIYVTTGYPPAFPIYAIRPGQRGDLSLRNDATSSDAIAWSHPRGGSYMITPIIYDDLLYLPANGGRLTAYDAVTGERVYRARLSQRGNFTGSPVAADGRLILPTNEGLVYIVEAGREFRELAVNDMQELITATPSISDGAIYLRTRRQLYALAETKP
ncbi:MAG: PQQ-binding-like beta-propeller repeat protein [Acidobacteriota bacterium]